MSDNSISNKASNELMALRQLVSSFDEKSRPQEEESGKLKDKAARPKISFSRDSKDKGDKNKSAEMRAKLEQATSEREILKINQQVEEEIERQLALHVRLEGEKEKSCQVLQATVREHEAAKRACLQGLRGLLAEHSQVLLAHHLWDFEAGRDRFGRQGHVKWAEGRQEAALRADIRALEDHGKSRRKAGY
jgi:hypothetical protein